MILRDIFFASFLVFSAHGCTGEDDGGDGDVGDGIEAPCRSGGEVCAEDQLCGETECEPAFDRDYDVRLSTVWSREGGRAPCLDNPTCYFEKVSVYLDDGPNPILGIGEPKVAKIHVKQDSHLLVDLQHSDCVIELTSARLRDGLVSCSGIWMTAFLRLEALPL